MKENHFYAVIMAGGGGTRLWPLSRQNKPKQMLNIGGDRSLFQRAVDRLDGLFDPDHIFIVTVEAQAVLLQIQCPQIPKENYLLEPLPRGTASVVGFAAAVIQKRDPQATMAVLTADHFIAEEKKFQTLLIQAYHVAQEGYLVTLGIEPTYAATAYGYLQWGDSLCNHFDKGSVYAVQSFREKPDQKTAEQFLEQGNYLWNSGMFIWQVSQIWQEFRQNMPQLFRVLTWISEVIGEPDEKQMLHVLWPTIKPETIDYGIMEKAAKVAVIPSIGLGWNDVGSWDSMDEIFAKDDNNNVHLSASHVGFDSEHLVICSDETDRLIVTIGMDGYIIVDTNDVLLVCKKDEAQRVKDMVAHLKRLGLEQYL